MIKRVPVKKISDKRRKRLSSKEGREKDLFLKLIKERGRTDTSGRPIAPETAQSFQFAHILPKGMYPEFRLNPNNIIIVDNISQHNRVDSVVAGLKGEFKMFIQKGTAVKILHDLYVSQFSGLE